MHSSESYGWSPRQKAQIVVGVALAALVVISVLVYGYQRYQKAQAMKGVEKIEELGFGFRRLTIAKLNKTELGHYPFFFYRNRLLCQIGPPPSISPSGNFAIYQDVRTGKLNLFRRSDEKVIELTKTPIGVAQPFVWHEDKGTVEAEIGKEGMSMEFPLK